MKQPHLITLAALVTLALAACASADSTNPEAERGIEERPDRNAQVTLPPQWTPTPAMAPSSIPEREPPTPTPAPDAFSALESGAPWLLYCDADERAALMDLDGPGRHEMEFECFPPRMVSGSEGFAINLNNLIQFPSGEAGRWVCCEMLGWSEDGNRALTYNDGMIADQTQLLVYDVATDREREVYRSQSTLRPLGLSPDGSWLVFLESESGNESSGSRTPPAELLALSYDGQLTRSLFSVYDAEVVTHSIAGWASESTALIARSESPCNLDPRNLELLYADLEAGTAKHLFDLYSEFAFDPEGQTVLLEELPPGQCQDEPQQGQLVLLSAADGWAPRPVQLPDRWGDDLDISEIEWHPELGYFSIRVINRRQPTTLRLATLDEYGNVDLSIRISGAQNTNNARMFPSPDGDLIVVGASPPHGTALYTHLGELVQSLAMPTGELSYGVQHLAWTPDGSAFYMSIPETRGIYRAAAEHDWAPRLVEPQTDYGTRMMLVEQPSRPFRPACGDHRVTRLYAGDQVVISDDPPLNSRLRQRPGLDQEVVGVLRPGQQARLVSGPVCGERYVWWELEAEPLGLQGWAAQGGPAGSWLLPVDQSHESR